MADRITWADRADGTGAASVVDAALLNEVKAVAADHADGIEAVEARATAVESTTATHTNEIAAAEAAIAALQAVDTTQAAELDAVESSVTALQGVDTAQAAEIDAVEADVSALQALTTSHTTDIEAVETSVTTLATSVGSAIDALEADVSTLQAVDAAQALEIDAVEASVAALEAVDAAQAAELDAVEASVAALEAVDTAQAAEIDAVEGDVATLQGTSATHATEIGDLGTSVTALQATDATQATEIDAVEASVTALDASKAAVDHDATHILGGVDEVDGDRLGIDYVPSSYTPTVVAPASDADHLTSHLAGIDAGLANAGGDRFQALRGLAADAHLSAPVETLGGDATTGLFATSLIRVFSRPTGDQLVMAVARQFLTVGGYLLGLDGNRFRFGISQDSDGGMLSNFINAELPEYEAIGRLFLISLSFDGTTATGRVNAQDEVTIMPAGGYREPSAVVVPYIGRNDNAGAPLPATGVEWLGGGYAASPRTPAQTEAHWLACMEASAFADVPGAALDSWWSMDGLESVPATLTDQGTGGVTLTRGGAGEGTLSLTDAKARF